MCTHGIWRSCKGRRENRVADTPKVATPVDQSLYCAIPRDLICSEYTSLHCNTVMHILNKCAIIVS
jgi:hypothetical protein